MRSGVALLLAVAQAQPKYRCASDDFFGSAPPAMPTSQWFGDPHAPPRLQPQKKRLKTIPALPSPQLGLKQRTDPLKVTTGLPFPVPSTDKLLYPLLNTPVQPAMAVPKIVPATPPAPKTDANGKAYKMPKAKPFPCNFCAASFMSELQRSKHHNAHQKGRLSHKCTICQVAVSNLTIHMRIHTNTRPFQCPHCQQSFTVSGSLNRHIRTHSGARPYKCTQCPKACSSSSDLKKHLRIHTGERPYKCYLCPKAFTVSGSLKNHLRTHTGERPYRCTQCKQSFTRSGDLKNHKRLHTGAKPYKCTQCSKAFGVAASLKAHLRSHNEKPSLDPSAPPSTPAPQPPAKSATPASAQGTAAPSASPTPPSPPTPPPVQPQLS